MLDALAEALHEGRLVCLIGTPEAWVDTLGRVEARMRYLYG